MIEKQTTPQGYQPEEDALEQSIMAHTIGEGPMPTIEGDDAYRAAQILRENDELVTEILSSDRDEEGNPGTEASRVISLEDAVGTAIEKARRHGEVDDSKSSIFPEVTGNSMGNSFVITEGKYSRGNSNQ